MHVTTRRIAAAVAVAVVAAVIGGAGAWALSGQDLGDRSQAARVHPPDPAAAARTDFPGLQHAAGEPDLPDLRTVHPRPGSVATLAGPFDDRFELSALQLGTRAVTGRLHVTSDVSDLLELQVLVGFYDDRGSLLGTGRYVHHLVEEHAHAGSPSEVEDFRVAIPGRIRDRVASAAVGVPVLVSE